MKTFILINIDDKLFQTYKTGKLVIHTVTRLTLYHNKIKIGTDQGQTFFVYNNDEYEELPDGSTLYASPFCAWSDTKGLIIHYNNIVESLEFNRMTLYTYVNPSTCE